MDDLSLYVLDITMNSVRAGATEISIELIEHEEWLDFSVSDNGCGMTEEQLAKLENPFFTTRKTRKVGLGIPFLKMLAEMTGGYVKITSVHETVSNDHGTKTMARFGRNHIDFIPLGDIVETIKTLIQGKHYYTLFARGFVLYSSQYLFLNNKVTENKCADPQ